MTFSQLSCLSCQEMLDWRELQFNLNKEKLPAFVKRAAKTISKDIFSQLPWSHTLIFAGSKETGAISWLIAVFLKQQGWDPVVIYTTPSCAICEQMQQSASENNVKQLFFEDFFESQSSSDNTTHIKEAILFKNKSPKDLKWDLIIDGFSDTEIKKNIAQPIEAIIKWSNQARSQRMALDSPTGWNQRSKIVFHADLTYCFHSLKKELLTAPLINMCGEFKLIDVGLEDPKQGPQIYTGNPLELLPIPLKTWHKYTRGSLYLAVGSDLYEGSSILAEKEAWKKISNTASLAGMVYTLSRPHHPQSVKWNLNAPKTSPATLVMGSGMQASDARLPLIFSIAKNFKAVIVDAGALGYLKENEEAWQALPQNKTVLTPHEGEARALLSLDKEANFDVLLFQAQTLARKRGVWFLLKSYVSHLLGPNGEHWIEPFGRTHLAVAGSGDRLAASIASASLHLDLKTALLFAMRKQNEPNPKD
jgi:NAD(P)H-hydrate repair Nnr-like enzyme with NAD(P)H-hydrate dehydratase domain/NAD(P)H-hydrate repair Nnr-like enzyme with NAD(P)H-hydrate epimerase domain